MVEQIRVVAANGDIVARDNFVVAFFSRRPFAEIVLDVRGLVEQWLKLVPADVLRWTLVGKSSTKYKKFSTQNLNACLEMLREDVAAKSDVYFKILGPQSSGPDHMALVVGFAKPAKVGFADQTNLVQFLFPMEFCAQFGEDRFVDVVTGMFDALPSDSGYAGPALLFGIVGDLDEAKKIIAPHALQHHGYDIANNAFTALLMGDRCRGARWLTMLSNPLVDRNGGIDRLRAQLADGVEVRKLSRGVVIRAGATPELGSVNRGVRTPLLTSVARAIEPITFFGDNSILPLFNSDVDQRDRWERRFFWNQD